MAKNRMKTLNNLSELKETGFGQPPPRHGLNLLWWFAHDCVRIDSNGRMAAKCNPANHVVGFEQFHNKEKLLPTINLPYYEAGNLHKPGSLPYYVTEKYTGYSDSSNTDRIIVSFNSSWKTFENIYVTQHSDKLRFDQNRTYCISIDLLKKITELQSREDFLRGRTNLPEQTSLRMPPLVQSQPRQSQPRQSQPRQSQPSTCQSKKCRCAMICCGLLIVLIAAAAVAIYVSLKMK